MRIFVTGGNGFIGSVVVKKLCENGHNVTCLLRTTSDTTRLEGLPYERALGDIRDAESVRAAMEGAEGCIHLASVSSWDGLDSGESGEVVLGGTRNVLAAAKALGGIRVVHVSSVLGLGASTPSTSVDETTSFNIPLEAGLQYSQFKHQSEELCRAAVANDGADVVIVNPGEVYGPKDFQFITAKTLVDFLKSSPVLVCDGGACIAHVDDVAAGTVSALTQGKTGERYILSGANLTIRELAELTLDVAGVQRRVVTLPNVVIKAVTKLATTLRIPLPYNPNMVPYATRYWFAENRKAREELGVQFRSARDTLAPTIEWLREAGHV